MELNLNQMPGAPGAISQAMRMLEAREDGVRDYVTEDGALIREQDVDEILARNHAERMEDRFQGFRMPPVFRKVGSIPVAVVDILKKYGLDILNNPDDLRRFLNDSAFKAFRTTNEKV